MEKKGSASTHFPGAGWGKASVRGFQEWVDIQQTQTGPLVGSAYGTGQGRAKGYSLGQGSK